MADLVLEEKSSACFLARNMRGCFTSILKSIIIVININPAANTSQQLDNEAKIDLLT